MTEGRGIMVSLRCWIHLDMTKILTEKSFTAIMAGRYGRRKKNPR